MNRQGAARAVVIVGAGQAGFQCAASLREKGWEGRILLAGDETEPPYYRPPLSKEYLRAEMSSDELPFRPGSFFERSGIDLILGDEVRSIDRGARRVLLASGARLDYDELVLATGAVPCLPDVVGASLSGVAVVRDRRHADELRERLPRCRSLVIVGGGFIGTEVAASVAASCEVTILERWPRVLMRSVSAPVAQRVREVHESHGVVVRTGAVVTALNGAAGRVRSVQLADGDALDADAVLFATGVAPRTALATAAGLDVSDGVRVDVALRTSDPHISAIGDCANFPSAFSAGRTRLESVQNAADQARHVAERIVTGTVRAYGAVPWFWTHQYEDKIQIAGIAGENDECVISPGGAAQAFSVYRVRGEAVVAVESVNAPRDHIRARKRLAAGAIPLAELCALGQPPLGGSHRGLQPRKLTL
jgi:3-phenylpropionate/trans-cinnamate dioxygenase ferredoxin reductase subunit